MLKLTIKLSKICYPYKREVYTLLLALKIKRSTLREKIKEFLVLYQKATMSSCVANPNIFFGGEAPKGKAGNI